MVHDPLLAGAEMAAAAARPEMTSRARLVAQWFLSVAATAGAVLLVLWQDSLVFSRRTAVAVPRDPANDPARSVYFGMGCFWHTQYDTFLVERRPPFSRTTDEAITSLVGYAGGNYMGAGGAVCYEGNPNTDYSLLGHTEVVSVELEPLAGNTSARATSQFEALVRHYFDEGFQRLPGGKLQRLDPMDSGPQYRNAVGLPGVSTSCQPAAFSRSLAQAYRSL